MTKELIFGIITGVIAFLTAITVTSIYIATKTFLIEENPISIKIRVVIWSIIMTAVAISLALLLLTLSAHFIL